MGGNVAILGQGTLISSGINALTGEIRYVAGTQWLPVKSNIYYSLDSGNQAIATLGDNTIYVALKLVSGVQIGAYPAQAIGGDGFSGNFSLAVSSVIDIVAQNKDTVNHVMGAYWQATTP